MSVTSLTAETTVAEVLERDPSTRAVFTAQGTACVGCYLARFCTLNDAAGFYKIPLETFMDEITQAASATIVRQGDKHA